MYKSFFLQESFNKSSFIDGSNSKARFGHSVAFLGDMNQDGFDGTYKEHPLDISDF